MKYKVEQVMLVYDDTPTFEGGAVVQIIDFDSHHGSYLVSTLQDVGKKDRDIQRLLDTGKWVKETDVVPLYFNRPKSLWQKFLGLFKREQKN